MGKTLVFCLVFVCLGISQEPYVEQRDFPPCSLQGKIILKSKAPALPSRHKITADVASCGVSIQNRNLLLAPDNGVQNAIVFLEDVKSGKPLRMENIVQISDEKCDFYPKVLAVAQGQPVTFRNGDKIYNDFRAVLENQVLFNIALPMAGQTFTKKMKKCGITDLYCNVHPWEHALILVCPHPYFTVSDAFGRFQLEQVPPGRYTLTAVHEVLGKKSMEVVIEPEKKNEAQVQY